MFELTTSPETRSIATRVITVRDMVEVMIIGHFQFKGCAWQNMAGSTYATRQATRACCKVPSIVRATTYQERRPLPALRTAAASPLCESARDK
jgi:hypothetical protein